MHINSNIHCIIGIIGILTIVMALLPLSTISLISFIGFFIPPLFILIKFNPTSIQFNSISCFNAFIYRTFPFLIYFAMGLFHPFRYSKYVTTCFFKTFMNMFFTPHSHPLSNLLLVLSWSWLFVVRFFFFVFHMFAFQGDYLQACLMHPPSFFSFDDLPFMYFLVQANQTDFYDSFFLFFFFWFLLFFVVVSIISLTEKKLLLLKKKKKRIAWSWLGENKKYLPSF